MPALPHKLLQEIAELSAQLSDIDQGRKYHQDLETPGFVTHENATESVCS